MSFIRTKKIKGHEYKYEVENYRINGKVRQIIIKYLGRADADKPVSLKWISKKTSALVRHNGMAQISISRKLAGQRVLVECRYSMPDPSG